MPPQRTKKFQLPKTLLEMKFMKRTKEKVEHAKEDEDRQKMFSHEITSGMLNEGPKFIEEPSLVPLLGLLEGRFSFRGMNPDIEKLMQSEKALKLEEQEKLEQEGREKSVTDLEMAETLTNAMARKFHSKKNWKNLNDTSSQQSTSGYQRKKFKFMKPNLDDE